jgi:hypothetical protein
MAANILPSYLHLTMQEGKKEEVEDVLFKVMAQK